MIHAYILIGGPHTRKSTVLRCLTGCFNRSVRDIELQRGAALKLYARVAALQASRTTVAEFIDEVQRSRCNATAFALLPDASPLDPQRLPDAEAYLAAFQAAGWQLDKLAVLGAHPVQPKGLAVLRCPNVLHQPVNSTAQQVRQHFGWR